MEKTLLYLNESFIIPAGKYEEGISYYSDVWARLLGFLSEEDFWDYFNDSSNNINLWFSFSAKQWFYEYLDNSYLCRDVEGEDNCYLIYHKKDKIVMEIEEENNIFYVCSKIWDILLKGYNYKKDNMKEDIKRILNYKYKIPYKALPQPQKYYKQDKFVWGRDKDGLDLKIK